MRLIPLVAALAITGACAAETAPLAEMAISDGQRLVQHWNASVMGRMWNDPLLADLRARSEAKFAEVEADSELPIRDTLLALRSAGLRISGFKTSEKGTGPEPLMGFQLDLGERSRALFDLWMQREGEAAAVPGAAAAFTVKSDQAATIALFDTVITGGNLGVPAKPAAVPADPADMTWAVDSKQLMQALSAVTPEADRADFEAGLAVATPYLRSYRYDLTVLPEGMLERVRADGGIDFLIPVDPAVVGRLPANTLLSFAVGVDGEKLWASLRVPVLSALAKQTGGSDLDEAEALIDSQLGGVGIDLGIAELLGGIRGTAQFAVTQAAPFPGFSLILPRSPGMDAAVIALLAQIQSDPPAEGDSTQVQIPGMPLPLSLARDAGTWLVSSDALLGSTWVSGAAGGWSDAPAGKLALAKAGDGAVVIGASDTPAIVQMISPYLAMALGQAPDMEPKQRQNVLKAVEKLASLASTGYVFARGGANFEAEARGLFGASMVPLMGAAIAIPNLLESRVTANQNAAASTLKSGVFPAQIQFQGGGYSDSNEDGLGDYGFFEELSGATPVGGVELNLMDASFQAHEPVVNGYRYLMFVKDDQNGAVSSIDGRRTVKGNADQFVAYAVPEDAEQGRKMFAVTTAGTVYTTPFTGEMPDWNALWGGGDKGWADQPVWQPYRR
ncbi:MAG: hypothetical protein H0W72_08260 [Planctomycetes bacterium]|nr:hypothetical protein [Planctomycetota bacterium]